MARRGSGSSAPGAASTSGPFTRPPTRPSPTIGSTIRPHTRSGASGWSSRTTTTRLSGCSPGTVTRSRASRSAISIRTRAGSASSASGVRGGGAGWPRRSCTRASATSASGEAAGRPGRRRGQPDRGDAALRERGDADPQRVSRVPDDRSLTSSRRRRRPSRGCGPAPSSGRTCSFICSPSNSPVPSRQRSQGQNQAGFGTGRKVRRARAWLAARPVGDVREPELVREPVPIGAAGDPVHRARRGVLPDPVPPPTAGEHRLGHAVVRDPQRVVAERRRSTQLLQKYGYV